MMNLMRAFEVQASSTKAFKYKLQRIINLGDNFTYKNIVEILSTDNSKKTRPKNAWQCYLDHFRKNGDGLGWEPGMTGAQINKIASPLWKNLSDEEKKPFQEKAKQLSEEFAKQCKQPRSPDENRDDRGSDAPVDELGTPVLETKNIDPLDDNFENVYMVNMRQEEKGVAVGQNKKKSDKKSKKAMKAMKAEEADEPGAVEKKGVVAGKEKKKSDKKSKKVMKAEKVQEPVEEKAAEKDAVDPQGEEAAVKKKDAVDPQGEEAVEKNAVDPQGEEAAVKKKDAANPRGVKKEKKLRKEKEEVTMDLWGDIEALDFTRMNSPEGSSNKFWEYVQKANVTLVRYGKAGAKVLLQQKTFKDEATASKFLEKEIHVKGKKGYIQAEEKVVVKKENAVKTKIEKKPLNKKEDTTEKTGSTTYYKQINGIKYDKSLLETAEKMIKGEGDAAAAERISKNDAENLWKCAMDGNRVTDCENKTLEYILDNYNLTECAREFLEGKLNVSKYIEEPVVSKDSDNKDTADRGQEAVKLKNHNLPDFDKIDTNKDGVIDRQEFEAALGNNSVKKKKNSKPEILSDEDEDELMAETDSDHDSDRGSD
jgi:predicted DNA-binding WGR domain protein